jgi:3-deoxy-D-manno-octulosonate 8-phosphate phosphatase (KDO 8-P phosphatase)
MIELLVLDVDGTLTDGKIIYSSNEEFKNFDVKDGLAIATWTKKLGKKVAIITGRESKLLEKRAKELGVSYLYQGIDNKIDILNEIVKKENITLKEVGAIGDDLNDYSMLKSVGKSFAPANAVEDILKRVDVVLDKNGGEGAVRMMIELILKEDYKTSLFEIWQ